MPYLKMGANIHNKTKRDLVIHGSSIYDEDISSLHAPIPPSIKHLLPFLLRLEYMQYSSFNIQCIMSCPPPPLLLLFREREIPRWAQAWLRPEPGRHSCGERIHQAYLLIITSITINI